MSKKKTSYIVRTLALAALLLTSCSEDGGITEPPPPPMPKINSAPVADAGPDSTVGLPASFMLDGSGSSDVDGDSLRYRWRLIATPANSSAVLSDTSAVSPSFASDSTGAYVAQLIVNDGMLDSAPDTVTVTLNPSPGITLFVRATGAGLQQRGSALLRASDHGGINVHIESSDPATALVAPDEVTAGSASANVFVANDSVDVHFVIQGVSGVTGTVTITVTAAGFLDEARMIDIVQPGLVIAGLDTLQSVGTDRLFFVRLGLPKSVGEGLSEFQAVSAAVTMLPTLTVMSSDGAIASIAADGDTGMVVSFDVAAGEFQPVATFVPRLAGNTIVGASIPGFISTNSVDIMVDAPGITPFARTIGAGLQFRSFATLEEPKHGGVVVRIESADTTVALIAPDDNTAGSRFVDVFVADGNDVAFYTVQGVLGAAGAVNVIASAPGFGTGIATVDIVQAGVAMSGLPPAQKVGVNDAFTVFFGIPNSTGSGLSGFQGMSAANVPQLAVTVMSSDPMVSHVTAVSATSDTAGSVTIEMNAGEFQPIFRIVPLMAGLSTISASVPGFVSTTSASVDIDVAPPAIAPFSRTIGAGLQFSHSASLAISNHGGVTVRLESSDSTVALVAPDATTPGSRFIDVVVAGGSSVVPYTVQGVAGARGTVTVSATAPGFTGGAGNITIVEPGIVVVGLPGTVTAGVQRAINVRLGTVNALGTGLSGVQAASAANVPPLLLTVMSSDGIVAQLIAGSSIGATVMMDVLAGVSQPGLIFDPLAVGMTTVTASIPGFRSTDQATVNVQVDP